MIIRKNVGDNRSQGSANTWGSRKKGLAIQVDKLFEGLSAKMVRVVEWTVVVLQVN